MSVKPRWFAVLMKDFPTACFAFATFGEAERLADSHGASIKPLYEAPLVSPSRVQAVKDLAFDPADDDHDVGFIEGWNAACDRWLAALAAAGLEIENDGETRTSDERGDEKQSEDIA